MTFLITGYRSGLGRYLHEQLRGIGFGRDASSADFANINRKGVDVIIHCAFNKSKEVSSENFYQYLLDNLFLTERLIKIPHKKFIYISSVDVYPKNKKKHSEDEIISIDQVSGIYALTKLMSESLIKNLCQNFLILRCSSLLGRDAKENSLIKIIKEENPTVTLSPKSELNFILYKDVLEFIKKAIEKDLQETYNLVSSRSITLSQIVELFKKKVKFGDYIYNVGNINNRKACQLLPSLRRSSEMTINKFAKQIA